MPTTRPNYLDDCALRDAISDLVCALDWDRATNTWSATLCVTEKQRNALLRFACKTGYEPTPKRCRDLLKLIAGAVH